MCLIFPIASEKEAMILLDALDHLYDDIFKGLKKTNSYEFYDITDLSHRLTSLALKAFMNVPDANDRCKS